MNPFDNLYRFAMLGESMSPTLVDERGEDLMYLGYPIDSCTGVTDAKWLIKRVITFTLDDGSTRRAISYAGGSRAFTSKWTERESLSYPLTPSCASLTDAELREELRKTGSIW